MDAKMWSTVNDKFKKYPARKAVAFKMLELGLRVDENSKIYCGDLKISDSALANSVNVDRRVIKSTINVILKDEELFNIFGNIMPAGTLLKNIAQSLGLGVIEIEVGQNNQGLLAAVALVASNRGIDIRQAYASDNHSNKSPVLTLITNDPVPSASIKEFLNIDGVIKVSVY